MSNCKSTAAGSKMQRAVFLRATQLAAKQASAEVSGLRVFCGCRRVKTANADCDKVSADVLMRRTKRTSRSAPWASTVDAPSRKIIQQERGHQLAERLVHVANGCRQYSRFDARWSKSVYAFCTEPGFGASPGCRGRTRGPPQGRGVSHVPVAWLDGRA